MALESQGANHRVYFNGVQLINYEDAPRASDWLDCPGMALGNTLSHHQH